MSDAWARAALTAGTLAIFAAGAFGMWRGWRRRARGQESLLPLPAAPESPVEPLLPPATGLYIGTTIAGDWQNRVTAGQLSSRSAGTLALTEAGVTIERTGSPTVFVPSGALREARQDEAGGGKVLRPGDLLVVTWEHRDVLLDTAFRADQRAVHGPYLHALLDLIRAGRPTESQPTTAWSDQ